MFSRRYKDLTIIFVLISTLIIYSATFAGAQNANIFLEKKNLHPKMESVLSELEEEHGRGLSFAKEFSSKRNIKIDERNRITIFIYLEEDKPLNIKSLEAYGAEVIKGTNDVIKAEVPLGMLKAIADNVEGVSFIKLPNKPLSQTTSQGVSLTGASFYHSTGYTGSGVKVAVIDVGFKGLSNAIQNGELPGSIYVFDCTGSRCVNKTYPWSGIWEGEEHGTAVAEIVQDMAPGAQLYLIKIDDAQDLVDAKNLCITNGIKIINHSVGWFNTNFYDGSCYNSNPVCTANDAYNNGILWVNAAGNYAQEHYEATFRDSNLDFFHDQVVSFSAVWGDPIEIYLTWNAWPTTDQDYDLYLLDGLGNVVAYSGNLQTGTQPPEEEILLYAPYTGTYYVRVLNWSTTSNHRIKIFTPDIDLTPHVASSSLVSPADATNALAVAAINWANWTTGPQEDFSSQGPTTDGRIKPDISGPDNVSSFTVYNEYLAGESSTPFFLGTSAAAPHAAGAAALILSANPGYSVSQLWDSLTSSAIDMGNPGKDNIYGSGLVQLPAPPTGPLSNTTEFVKQQYRDFLNREADAGGLAHWVNQIDTGAMTRAQVIESFFWSEEFGVRVAPIVRLYFAYFLRIPDYGGLMYWVDACSSGASLWAVSDSFAGSEEFGQRYGSLTNDGFVELIYHNILGRSPDSGGYAYWVGELNSGRQTRGQVMVGFSESNEYKSTSSNEVFVTMMYVGMLRRSPEQGGFDYWVNQLDSGGSGLALIDGFLNSQEYASRCH